MRPMISALVCCTLALPFSPAFPLATAAWRPVEQPSDPLEALDAPLRPPVVARPFDAPEHDFAPGHRGVDLAGTVGSPVLAAESGVVRFAGAVAGRGVVAIDRPGGLRTTYEPVTPLLRTGDSISRGQPIGLLQPGHCPEPCLHWGVRRGERYLDPMELLASGRVRLLPW